jgi:tetratricopeptide (TPR) repeat protein
MNKPRTTLVAALASAALLFAAARADVAKDPTLAKAEALMKTDQPLKAGQAPALVDSYLAAHPKDARALADRGDILEGQRKYPEADASYTQALAIEPAYSGVLISRCETRRFLNRDAEAIADCTAAIKLEPKASIAYSERAMALLMSGQTGQALLDANKAVYLDPKDDFAFSTRCRINDQFEDYATAEGDCSEALRIYPSIGPLYFRALARYRLKRDSEALADINGYIEHTPGDGDGYMLRAQIHDGLGNDAAAHDDSVAALAAFRAAKNPQGAANAQHFLVLLAGGH